jgi:hypothetical protein
VDIPITKAQTTAFFGNWSRMSEWCLGISHTLLLGPAKYATAEGNVDVNKLEPFEVTLHMRSSGTEVTHLAG